MGVTTPTRRHGLDDLTVRCAGCGAVRDQRLVKDAPRTPCSVCGSSILAVAVTLSASLTFTADIATVELTPAVRSQEWMSLWEVLCRELPLVTGLRIEPLSAEEIKSAGYSLMNFLVSAYHLKDVLKAESSAIGIAPGQVEAAINADRTLRLLADVANTRKHKVLKRSPRSGSRPIVEAPTGQSLSSSRGAWALRVRIIHKGTVVDGSQLARDSMQCWFAALQGWGLPAASP